MHESIINNFNFDYLLSMDNNPSVKKRDWSWVWTQIATYVRLRQDASPQALQLKLAKMAERVIKPAIESRGMNFSEEIKKGS